MLKDGSGFKKVIICTGRTDLRRGVTGLSSIIYLKYGMDPIEEGTLFLFCGSQRNRIKGLLYEGDGFLLITKYLDHGVFQWPRNAEEARLLTMDDFHRLMDGYSIVCSIPTPER